MNVQPPGLQDVQLTIFQLTLETSLMALILGVISLVAALALLVPVTVLFIECMAASLGGQPPVWQEMLPRPTVAVLVPAHNEALGIGATLTTLVAQMTPLDRLIVIADNCEDETAAIAQRYGATVIERQDATRRGKGYALDFGLKALHPSPPDVVVIVDADCLVAPGAIETIARQAITYQRPVQATYLMARPERLSSKTAVSLLAFTIKNLVRPLGLNRLGLPCLLTGTGMAFPWGVMEKISLATGNIVEDMKLALDLALVGYPPMFCAAARVTGALPQQDRAARSQRTRWEHGHLQMLLTQGPRLLHASLHKRRFDLLAMALDLCIPPLSLLVMLWLVATVVAVFAGIFGESLIPVSILALEGLFILVAILVSWANYASAEIPFGALLAVPFYVMWKIPLYLAFLVKPQTRWVRTERDRVDTSNL